jgi:2-oxoglutarate ferredoxin oxidoreductase subunit beta
MREYEKYIRYETFPTPWCPGCGNGVVMKSIAMALSDLDIDNNDVIVVSGIGCSGRLSTYFKTNTLHTTHGRALTFATGVKLSKPEKMVIVISGDGDASSIGGNHLIHAARRNIGLKLIIINNGIYGMTGGQVSPLTLPGFYTETTPYGNIEPQFDLKDLLIASKASFVARESITRLMPLKSVIKKSFEHTGFSCVEVISNCHVNLGRRNKMKSSLAMTKYIKDITYLKEQEVNLSEDEKINKLPLGVFVQNTSRPEYSELYFNHVIPASKASMKKGGG